jgi:N-acetylmuramoyl-L-alanine amidase
MRRRAILGATVLLFGGGIFFVAMQADRDLLASLFFSDDVTSEAVRSRYQNGVVSVLIVPGHDDIRYGAEYNGIREADLTRAIGGHLYTYLSADPKFDARIVRDQSGYAQEFAQYFEAEREGIREFIGSARRYFNLLRESRLVEQEAPPIQHNRADPETQNVLYGINRWANEHGMDLVIHLHVNDYSRRSWEQEYDGFSIYVPADNLPNHAVSREIAEHLAAVFSRYWLPSNLPLERETILETDQLIAVGSYGSLRSGSVLLELGYIYESRFHNDATLKEAAFRAYQGLLSFFDDAERAGDDFAWILPYQWTRNLAYGSRSDADAVALQTALVSLGIYPPAGETFRECPVNGTFRGCTEAAVQTFQRSFGIEATGTVGPKTRAKLNELFSERRI